MTSNHHAHQASARTEHAAVDTMSNLSTAAPAPSRWTEERINAVLRDHENGLIRYATRLLHGDSERAREVVQDTLLRLCRSEPEQVGGHLTEWLYTVCRHRALDVARKERRMTPFTDRESAVSERSIEADLTAASAAGAARGGGPTLAGSGASQRSQRSMTHDDLNPVHADDPDFAAGRETQHRMLDLLDTLSPNQQEVIRLKFQGGLTYKQISSVTELSVSNVGFLIHTGLKRLREQVLAGDPQPALSAAGGHRRPNSDAVVNGPIRSAASPGSDAD